MINPLDLPGPDFLLFYIIFGAFVAGASWVLQNHLCNKDGRQSFSSMLTDPYLAAYLSGGARKAWSVAVFALINRGRYQQYQSRYYEHQGDIISEW